MRTTAWRIDDEDDSKDDDDSEANNNNTYQRFVNPERRRNSCFAISIFILPLAQSLSSRLSSLPLSLLPASGDGTTGTVGIPPSPARNFTPYVFSPSALPLPVDSTRQSGSTTHRQHAMTVRWCSHHSSTARDGPAPPPIDSMRRKSGGSPRNAIFNDHSTSPTTSGGAVVAGAFEGSSGGTAAAAAAAEQQQRWIWHLCACDGGGGTAGVHETQIWDEEGEREWNGRRGERRESGSGGAAATVDLAPLRLRRWWGNCWCADLGRRRLGRVERSQGEERRESGTAGRGETREMERNELKWGGIRFCPQNFKQNAAFSCVLHLNGKRR
ncbi:hypothetical protein L1049_012211 [Liquidambar formosana]|uniref:Uncharacterized protein n=1 Tax=Liquidambar formosana TaxID=63359 RepID=A0AAP0RSF1_LIQFO